MNETKYQIHLTATYKKAYKKLVLSGNFSKADSNLLNDLIENLANDVPLEVKYQDHSLQGYGFKTVREFHFRPNLLVRYERFENILVLSLEEIGNHNIMFD